MNMKPNVIVPARASSLGAAIKILHAGGLELSDDQMRTASSLSAYMWQRNRDEVKDLVRAIGGD